ncbi:MAG: glycosyltransferase family 4 protein [Tepidisphaeraceae bacterium]|jgi:glycosyltransferase involved in cell wall biosynthesis
MLVLPINRLLEFLASAWAAVSMFMLAVRYRFAPGRSATDKSGGLPLRVLFVHRDLPFHGGVPRCLLYLARACDKQRIDFHLATFSEPSHRMTEAFGELGIKARCIGDRGYLKPIQNIQRIVKEDRIDVIVGTSFKAYLCSKMAARATGAGVMFWIHAVRGAVEGRFRRIVMAIVSRHDPLLFVSNAVKEAQLPIGHLGPVKVIYNGVENIQDHPEYDPYPPQMRQTLGVPLDALTLAFTAEFVGWKDHYTAIAAMHELARRGRKAHLMLIGAGELIQKARDWAQAGPAAERIHFLGARSDARRILGAIDIYIHPSRGEGFGLAAVEAMLAGCPVIAAREGAFKEYIQHGQTGLLFNPGDASDLADAVEKLADDPQRARQLGQASRKYCSEAFNIDHFADSICTYIEKTHPVVASRRENSVALEKSTCAS